MSVQYPNKERESKRTIFAKNRRAGRSIAASCKAASMSPTTYYSWNKGDSWSKGSGWSK